MNCCNVLSVLADTVVEVLALHDEDWNAAANCWNCEYSAWVRYVDPLPPPTLPPIPKYFAATLMLAHCPPLLREAESAAYCEYVYELW